MQHVWAYDHDTQTDCVFKCQNQGCGLEVGFNHPGVGEPSATSDKVPDDIDSHVGPCAGIETPTPTQLEVLQAQVAALTAVVLGTADVDALVAAGKVTADQSSIVKGVAAVDASAGTLSAAAVVSKA